MASATVFESSQQNVAAVVGANTAQGDGVFGNGDVTGRGVVGVSQQHTDVEGNSQTGDGVFGNGGVTGRGVVGVSQQHTGVEGNSQSGVGVFATSNTGEAIHAIANSGAVAAIAGFNTNPNGLGAAIFGQKAGEAGYAGFSTATSTSRRLSPSFGTWCSATPTAPKILP